MTHDGLERFKSKRGGDGASPPIATVELPQPDRRSKSKRFAFQWIPLPMYWVKALRRTSSAKTYELAITILAEFHKRRRFGVTEVVLSTDTTKMTRSTKLRAAKELEQLGLITLITEGKHALRAIPHNYVGKRYNSTKGPELWQ
jgi:hypothetical protein